MDFEIIFGPKTRFLTRKNMFLKEKTKKVEKRVDIR